MLPPSGRQWQLIYLKPIIQQFNWKGVTIEPFVEKYVFVSAITYSGNSITTAITATIS